jgi:tRNA(Ile)-lysidine synthase
MPPVDDFSRRFAANWPPESWHDVTVLVGVSGGADSVAALRALAELKGEVGGRGKLVAAHVHHGLRGTEADEDRDFVVALAGSLQLPCEIGDVPVVERAAADGDGIEAAARALRYEWMLKTAHRVGARYVVTAHTADDQAETVLHRVLRGSGLGGLRGIKRVRELGDGVSLIRPLLPFRRAELRAYLEQLGQPFREDGSNSDRGLTRNRLRLDLLPKLADEYNPQVIEALVRLGQLAAEAQQVIDHQVTLLRERVVTPVNPRTLCIDLRGLVGQSRYLISELFVALWREQRWPRQAMGLAEWDRLTVLAVGTGDAWQRQMFPGRIVAERDGDQLRLFQESTSLGC